jgi:hypothetical protein
MVLDAILERLGLPVKFNSSTINTRSMSIKVSMVKLCVPLNHQKLIYSAHLLDFQRFPNKS